MRLPTYHHSVLRLLAERHPEPARRIVGAEIGVWRGNLSRTLLARLPNLLLYLVDAWATYEPTHPYARSGDSCARYSAQQQQDNYLTTLETVAQYGPQCRVIREESIMAVNRFSDGELDFAFIDADHTLEAVRADIAAWAPKVRSGGILCGHDHGSPRDLRGVWGVSRAVGDYAAQTGRRVRVHPGHVWVVE